MYFRIVFLLLFVTGRIFVVANPTEPRPEEGIDICELPADPGPCDQPVWRFFYNIATGKCEKFTFGGCQGNGNNFESLEGCQLYCAEEEYAQSQDDLTSDEGEYLQGLHNMFRGIRSGFGNALFQRIRSWRPRIPITSLGRRTFHRFKQWGHKIPFLGRNVFQKFRKWKKYPGYREPTRSDLSYPPQPPGFREPTPSDLSYPPQPPGYGGLPQPDFSYPKHPTAPEKSFDYYDGPYSSHPPPSPDLSLGSQFGFSPFAWPEKVSPYQGYQPPPPYYDGRAGYREPNPSELSYPPQSPVSGYREPTPSELSFPLHVQSPVSGYREPNPSELSFPLQPPGTGPYLPQEDDSWVHLPNEDAGFYLPEEDAGFYLPEEDAGFYLPEGDSEDVIPEEDYYPYLSEEDYGSYLPEEDYTYQFPEDNMNKGYRPRRSSRDSNRAVMNTEPFTKTALGANRQPLNTETTARKIYKSDSGNHLVHRKSDSGHYLPGFKNDSGNRLVHGKSDSGHHLPGGTEDSGHHLPSAAGMYGRKWFNQYHIFDSARKVPATLLSTFLDRYHRNAKIPLDVLDKVQAFLYYYASKEAMGRIERNMELRLTSKMAQALSPAPPRRFHRRLPIGWRRRKVQEEANRALNLGFHDHGGR